MGLHRRRGQPRHRGFATDRQVDARPHHDPVDVDGIRARRCRVLLHRLRRRFARQLAEGPARRERNRAIQSGLENATFERDYRFSTFVGPAYQDDSSLGVLYNDDGTLKPLAEIKEEGNTEKLASLANAFEDEYNHGRPNGTEISVHNTYWEGYKTHYGSAAVDADHEDSKGWRSDEESVNWIYGDSAEARENSDNHLHYHPDDPREPYQPGRDQITDDAFHPAK